MNPTDLILIAVLNSKRDFEIARVLGWYRIPFATAPKTVNVDYVAFYQTAKFGAEKWAINYVAPVRGHELTTRAELLRTEPDHPRAQEQYYRIQIGPLERLPKPIPSRKWRRITFLYSTGERLMAAAEINDLIVQSAEREMLWAALRERQIAAERQYQTGQKGGEVDFAILCALGNLGIICAHEPKLLRERGWEYVVFSESRLREDLAGCMVEIEGAVGRLGGPVPQ
ncbi:MAG: hypothetical protein HY023_08070 [Chloroflexi bacterium]|nr:hypothetical protein [Chloroflexota bacterium]